MTWYRCIGGSKALILDGTASPISSQGSNGQVYLQTIKGVKQDLSTFFYAKERDMSVVNYDNAAYFLYAGSGPYIGAQLYREFDLTNIDLIEISVKSTSPSYDNYSTERFSPILLIENTINPSSSFPVNTSMVSANGETYRVTTQGDSVTFIADVSSLTGNYWIVLSSIGATSLWSDFYLCSSDDNYIVRNSFAKVSNAWQDLIGTDIDDIENVSENEPIVIDSIIPRMTSDTTPKGKCSASYVYSGRYAYYGFTTPSNGNVGNANEFWYYGGSSSANNWIEYEFAVPSTIMYVSFGTIQDGVGKRVKIQYSNDETNWTDIKTIEIATNDYTTYKLPSPVYCKYMRLFIVDNGMIVISGINAFGFEDKDNIRKSGYQVYSEYDEGLRGIFTEIKSPNQGGTAPSGTLSLVYEKVDLTNINNVVFKYKNVETLTNSSNPRVGISATLPQTWTDVITCADTAEISGSSKQTFDVQAMSGEYYVWYAGSLTYNQGGYVRCFISFEYN